jgi:hypothetical protein
VSGGARRQTLRLGPGRWDISLRYRSDVPLRVRAGTLERTLPAYVTDDSTFASVVTLVSRGGQLVVTVRVPARRRLETLRTVRLGTLVATRVDKPGRVVPLGRACGKYVDWYRLSRD